MNFDVVDAGENTFLTGTTSQPCTDSQYCAEQTVYAKEKKRDSNYKGRKVGRSIFKIPLLVQGSRCTQDSPGLELGLGLGLRR